MPGAFTGPCSNQVPGYIKAYDQFKAKGVENIYVIAVNDTFVMKAWKEKLAPEGTRQSNSNLWPSSAFFPHIYSHLGCVRNSLIAVHFIADDQGAFTGALGMLFDASGLLGAPRSKVRHVASRPSSSLLMSALFSGMLQLSTAILSRTSLSKPTREQSR